MKQTGYDMLYLSACAVNGIKPDSDYITHIDLAKLFQMCQFHSLTAIVCMALESAGITDKKFIEAKSKAIRKNILLDAEREKILDFLEQNKIWYMPLKGIILKEFYQKIGMRQMADNDILYDKSYQKRVFEFMKKRGYTAESVGKSHHDTYTKLPVYNFEMHTDLFVRMNNEKYYSYYSEIKKRLVQDEKKSYLYHFTDEDFYVYMIAHEYKHYSQGGTGLRSLLDCFVYVQEKENSLDWDYITQQTDIFGITDFEQESRKLAMKIFTNQNCNNLSDNEKEMLKFYLFSGTYGTMKHSVEKRVRTFNEQNGSTSKFRYIWYRIFPPMEVYRQYFPFFYQHKFLLPVCWIFRLARTLIYHKKRLKSELYFIYHSDSLEKKNK